MGVCMSGEPHRLDGFDPDAALEEIRELCSWLARADWSSARVGMAAQGKRLGVLTDLLDHWLILGCEPPAEWSTPAPELAGAALRVQPKRPGRRWRRAKRP
jgi:hypothetical protein